MKTLQLTDVAVIVLDFDGVITESGEALKEKAWENLATRLETEEQEVEERFLAELRKQRSLIGQGKGSRFDILRNTFGALGFADEEVERKVARYACIYNDEVQRLIQEEPMSEGAAPAIELLAEKYPLYIVTATPVESVKESLEVLGILKFFKNVLGFPPAKCENLIDIGAREGVSSDKILFIGDTEGDIKAATEFGCQFVGRANSWNKWRDMPFPLVRTLPGLVQMIGLGN